jgi:hypothetical protein
MLCCQETIMKSKALLQSAIAKTVEQVEIE